MSGDLLPSEISAVFSPCGRFRYLLRWVWNQKLPVLPWVLYNPSRAGSVDANGKVQDDHSARKGRGFCERLGYGGFVWANCFAFVSTESAGLRAAGYPVGPENDDYILKACREGAGDVVVAWGALATGLSRPIEVLDLIRGAGYRTMSLGRTVGGLPCHPLRLSYITPLEPF